MDSSGNKTDYLLSSTEDEQVPIDILQQVTVTQEFTSDINSDNHESFSEDKEDNNDKNNEDYVEEGNLMDIDKKVTQDEKYWKTR